MTLTMLLFSRGVLNMLGFFGLSVFSGFAGLSVLTGLPGFFGVVLAGVLGFAAFALVLAGVLGFAAFLNASKIVHP